MADDSVSRRRIARLATMIGCSGTHEWDGKVLPCRSHDRLLELSRNAEPEEKTARRKRKRKVSSRRGDGWENLRERPVSSLSSGGPGITSGSPRSEITATGSTGTAVAGGTMGGVVDGSFGVTSLGGSGVLSAKSLVGGARSRSSERYDDAIVSMRTDTGTHGYRGFH